MTFSLVHPSRGRVALAGETIREWEKARSGQHAVEHILSVDTDDPAAAEYRRLAEEHRCRIVINRNRTMIEAANRGADAANGDVLVLVSDDFGCPEHWDIALAEAIDGRARAAVLVHDGIDGRVLTLPVLTRAYAAELGYIYHGAYRSMFADDDLTEVARRDGVLIDARHLTFPHRHHSVGRSEEDATYARQDSGAAWWHGWLVFEKRRLEGFGTHRRTLSGHLAAARLNLYYWARTGGSAGRRWWRARLGPAGRAREARLRQLVLRLLARMTSVRGVES